MEMQGGLEEEVLQQIRSRATALLLKEDWVQYTNLYTHLISLCNRDDSSSNHKTLVSALSNRADGWSRLHNPAAALKDCDLALSIDPGHVKTLISKGKILLERGQYGPALECFRKVKSLSNGGSNAMVQVLLKKCRNLEAISRTGLVDLSEWVLCGFAGKVPELAEFMGPLEVRKSGHTGRGLFLTKNVDAGSILIITNAVATCRGILSNKSDERGQMVMWKNFVDKILGTVENCEKTLDLIHKLSNGDSDTELEVPDMGVFKPDLGLFTSDKVTTEVDVGHVLKVLDVNSLTEESVSAKVLGLNSGCQAVGLWILPSFVNHSCNPNARRIHVGDWLILHASRDIKAGEEVTSAYFDVLRPLPDRQESVKTWGFDCKCERCRIEEKVFGLFKELREIEYGFAKGSDLGGLVIKLEEAMRRCPVKEREKGYIRASFWDAYSSLFGSERSARKWGRKIELVQVAQSIFETVGADERILKLVTSRLKNGGNGNLNEMERVMRLARGTYGKVMRKQAVKALIEAKLAV
ncbi:SET and MYND domain-containing protein [Carex littledalei]|uniref:SET and MYND domain-containing protein n=1 Tax=Carex littledalei TaxID=544730 RepID=A0A833QH51_9POAL|nr:SET and MYND domain-containing protein [Carex littledalei]